MTADDAEARAVLAWSPQLISYDFGAGHPMAPVRLVLTMALMEELGIVGKLRTVAAEVASDEQLLRIHEPEYLAAVRRSQETGEQDRARGLGSEDVPVFGAVHDAAARIAGATLAAAQEISSGRAMRALSVAGGMHHAMPGRAAGFCVYNDAALAIGHFLDAGMRVAYIDIDAHHGDGVERALWNNPDALTISVHQHPDTIFPGTGFAQDVGGHEARGTAVNLALPPQTSDAQWLRAIEAICEPLIREFSPDVLVTQHGTDAHGEDPLTHLNVSVDAQRAAAVFLADLAEQHAGGRWLATGGGGYAVTRVVPRVWAHLAAIVAGEPLPLDTAIPQAWRDRVWALTHTEAPQTMGDEGADVVGDMASVKQFWQGYDPAHEVDRAILATRQTIFAFHGLDPLTA